MVILDSKLVLSMHQVGRLCQRESEVHYLLDLLTPVPLQVAHAHAKWGDLFCSVTFHEPGQVEAESLSPVDDIGDVVAATQQSI